MARRKARGAAGEEGVDVVPGEQRTVVAVAHVAAEAALREHGGHAAEVPLFRIGNVYLALGVLEVVDVGGVALEVSALARHELGELGGEVDVGGGSAMEQGELVEPVREELALLLPRHVEAPEGIVERFAAHRHLIDQRFLAEVHERTA